MTTDTRGLDAITRRLESLERDNRRLRRILLIGLLVATGAAAAAQQVVIPTAAHVKTERITLVDGDNRTRAVLETPSVPEFDGNPVLTFYDNDGHRRVRLGINDAGPILQTFDEEDRVHDVF